MQRNEMKELDVFRNGPRNPLTDEQQCLILNIKLKADELLDLVGAPSSRELSIFKTKLEEAVMWAVKGITA